MSFFLGNSSQRSEPGTGSASAAPQSAPLIEAEHLVKHYGQTKAVSDVSFRVARGEVVGFLGPNGAGKSTTMKMLTGFLRPTSGRAAILGIDMASHAIEAQRHIGYLPENAPLYDEMMVLDFLGFVADLRGIDGQRRRSQLRRVVERCGLGDVLGKDISELSKGYRQRVGLAQALLDDADLLILDEPTSGLDPNQIVDIRALIRDLGKEKTVLLSTHILSEVQAVCDRAIIINNGQIVADAAPEALGALAGGGIEVVVTLKERNVAAGGAPLAVRLRPALAALPNVMSVQLLPTPGDGDAQASFLLRAQAHADEVREAVFDLAVSEGCMLTDLHQREVSLEETFQRLTKSHSSRPGGRHAA